MCGVAKLEDRLYVVCDNSTNLFVFEAPYEKEVQRLVVNGLIAPQNIMACFTTKCLYISDRESSCIWKIKTFHLRKSSSQCVSPEKVKIKNLYNILTIESDGSLLAVNENAVLRYEANGSCSQICKLPDSIHVVHAVLTSHKHIIVSYTVPESHDYKTDCVWFVSEFDETGNRQRNSGPLPGRLEYARYLAVISKGGSDIAVLVADCDYNTVLLLDEDLKLSKYNILLNSQLDDILEPRRMLYDKESKELILGQNNGWVNIYNVDVLIHHRSNLPSSHVRLRASLL